MKQRSAVASAAYRAGQRLYDERQGQTEDYTRKTTVLHAEIMTPQGAPEWTQDRGRLWNAVEHVENRRDSQLYREVQVSLPHELDRDQQRELLRDFVQERYTSKGMIADVSLHAKHRNGQHRNDHAHIMLTTRPLNEQGTGFDYKGRSWNAKSRLEGDRKRWAEITNRHLARAGSRERIDHRSLADQRSEAWQQADYARALELNRQAQHKPQSIAHMEQRGAHSRGFRAWEKRRRKQEKQERPEREDVRGELLKQIRERDQARRQQSLAGLSQASEYAQDYTHWNVFRLATQRSHAPLSGNQEYEAISEKQLEELQLRAWESVEQATQANDYLEAQIGKRIRDNERPVWDRLDAERKDALARAQRHEKLVGQIEERFGNRSQRALDRKTDGWYTHHRELAYAYREKANLLEEQREQFRYGSVDPTRREAIEARSVDDPELVRLRSAQQEVQRAEAHHRQRLSQEGPRQQELERQRQREIEREQKRQQELQQQHKRSRGNRSKR
jgi:hypothetical protein